ncbi:MAG: 4Fe-4S dicluster domain-containing protein [Candidatus Omnitrophica bacterium]|nr:4Fe-4S dicluster domain-containing protein [Candidatus Omnitrophota bacterium]
MSNSAEQLHNQEFNQNPTQGADKRLYIDLDICASGQCEKCVIECSYYYHPDNNGIVSVAELATYALICRRCEEPQCVNACPVEALEQQKVKENLLIRHNMRCVSCKSCSHACPYGSIYPEHVPSLIHNCDFCIDRRNEKKEPLCITTCPYGALSLKSGSAKRDENTFLVGDNMIVHSTHWEREKA